MTRHGDSGDGDETPVNAGAGEGSVTVATVAKPTNVAGRTPVKTGGEGGSPAGGRDLSTPRTFFRPKNPATGFMPEDAQDGQGGQLGDGGTFGHVGHLRENRYGGLPVVFLRWPDGTVAPCPFLMSVDDVAAFFRLADSRTRFPRKTIERYRSLGLQTVRVGRRTWFRLDDVLRFLDQQQERLADCP